MTDEEKIYTVQPDKWAYGGEVMGRLPADEHILSSESRSRTKGRAVFIPFAIPGEEVKIRLVEEKRGFARAELLEVLTPSPERITPRCPHFAVCGGCHYQHMPYEAQLAAKQAVFVDSLVRIGKMDPELLAPLLRPIVPNPSPWNYRNHVQFHLDAEGRLGFRAARSDEIIAIDECHLPEESLNQLWPLLELDPNPTLRRVGLRSGVDDDAMLIFETDDDEGLEFSLDIPLAAVQLGPETLHILSDDAVLEMEVLDYSFQVSAGSFFQVNTQMAAAMVAHILEYPSLDETQTVLDVYCGVGLFSAFLAGEVGQLIGIEENPMAVGDFLINLDAFSNVEIYEAPAEEVLPELDAAPDVVLVDPPRAGLALPVLDAIIAMKPKQLVYVSCDPSTLARDAKRLMASGFVLEQVTPFDMFPQTYHIESISFWRS